MVDLVDINNGDTGLQSRTKINNSFDKVNGLVGAGIDYIPPPTGLTIHPNLTGIHATKQGDNFGCTILPTDLIDLSSYANKLYVDKTAVDGTGLSWASPRSTIGRAIRQASATGLDTRVFVRADVGTYNRDQGIADNQSVTDLLANISIEAVNGRVNTGTFLDPTWAKTGGQTNVYESTIVAVNWVYSLLYTKPDGTYKPLENVASIALCDSTAGSFFYDGTKVYIHDFSGLPVNNLNNRCMRSSMGAGFSGDKNLYMYGFDLEGGITGAFYFGSGTGETNTVVLDSCTTRYAMDGRQNLGFAAVTNCTIQRCSLFAAFNCDFSAASRDGLGITATLPSQVIPHTLTVNCTSYGNGSILPNIQSCNGITGHDGSISIDIGGKYLGSVGTNSGFVADDTQLWQVGGLVGSSEGDELNGGLITWGAFGAWAGTTELWLDYCVDVGASIGVYAADGAQVNIRNHKGQGSHIGNVVSY